MKFSEKLKNISQKYPVSPKSFYLKSLSFVLATTGTLTVVFVTKQNYFDKEYRNKSLGERIVHREYLGGGAEKI